MSNHIPLPRIRCVQCGKPVERIEVSRNMWTWSSTITVWCHGDSESMALADSDIEDIGQEVVKQIQQQEGLAFVTKRLEAVS